MELENKYTPGSSENHLNQTPSFSGSIRQSSGVFWNDMKPGALGARNVLFHPGIFA